MLVLNRKVDEAIVMPLPDGRTVRLLIVDIRGDDVKLGIEAPREIEVHRKEVWEERRREAE